MMSEKTNKKDRICPWQEARSLEMGLRKWAHSPRRILRDYISEGFTVLDYGCGPGFFTIPIAERVGNTGRVIALDIQPEMLAMVESKALKSGLELRIQCMKSDGTDLDLNVSPDFILMFYVAHEIPDKKSVFENIVHHLKPGGKLWLIEPPFHVSPSGFQKTVGSAEEAGLKPLPSPRVFPDRTQLFGKT